MSEEKKSRYTESQKKAIQKYLHETVEEFKVRVPKGRKAEIQAHATQQGESMNAFVVRAIQEAMQRDNSEDK